MVLLCAARFGSSPQKILIDAAWTNTILSPANPSPTCALLALDGSLRLAAAGSAACNRSLVDPNAGTSSDADDSLEASDEYLPVSQFEFNSSISSDVDWNSKSDFITWLLLLISFILKFKYSFALQFGLVVFT